MCFTMKAIIDFMHEMALFDTVKYPRKMNKGVYSKGYLSGVFSTDCLRLSAGTGHE